MASTQKHISILWSAISLLDGYSHELGGAARQRGYRESHTPALVLYLFLCQNNLWPHSTPHISIPLFMLDELTNNIKNELCKIQCTPTEALSLSTDAFVHFNKKVHLLQNEASYEWDIVGSVITNNSAEKDA
jgi:hypothetical protein